MSWKGKLSARVPYEFCDEVTTYLLETIGIAVG